MENREYNYADVKIRAENVIVSIPVTSVSKPVIPVSLKEKWQKIIDVTAKCMNVPAALIMQVHEHEISVLVSSRTLDNPYSVGSSEELKIGLYCETVLGKNSPLYIPDAMDNAYWCDNPDINLGMKSYLGYPVKWPDGEFFGTICVLDTIENPYMQVYAELLVLMQDVVERDLEQIFKNESPAAESDAGVMDMTTRLNNIVRLIDLIYNSSDRAAIPMGVCVRNILEGIKENYRNECMNISFGVDIPDLIKPVPDVVFSCGMIITEAVINSVTHAFAGRMSGEIYIMMREIRPGEYTLHVSDNGIGIFRGKRKSGSGMAIIEQFVRSLHGTVHISSDTGTSYYIDFKASGSQAL